MRPSAVRVTEALLAGGGLVLVVLAGLLAFLPVPPNGIGTCGPDYTSSSALAVYRDPDRVVDWVAEPNRVELLLRRECFVDAQLRVTNAFLLGSAGLLTGLAGPLVVETVWQRGGRARPDRADGVLAAR